MKDLEFELAEGLRAENIITSGGLLAGDDAEGFRLRAGLTILERKANLASQPGSYVKVWVEDGMIRVRFVPPPASKPRGDAIVGGEGILSDEDRDVSF